MQVSEKCKELLQEFNVSMLMSNILVADLEIIQYGIIDEKNDSSLDYVLEAFCDHLKLIKPVMK